MKMPPNSKRKVLNDTGEVRKCWPGSDRVRAAVQNMTTRVIKDIIPKFKHNKNFLMYNIMRLFEICQFFF